MRSGGTTAAAAEWWVITRFSGPTVFVLSPEENSSEVGWCGRVVTHHGGGQREGSGPDYDSGSARDKKSPAGENLHVCTCECVYTYFLCACSARFLNHGFWVSVLTDRSRAGCRGQWCTLDFRDGSFFYFEECSTSKPEIISVIPYDIWNRFK